MLRGYEQIALENKQNVYFLALGNKEHNIEKSIVTPINYNCNCYSVAKALTVLEIGLLHDQELITPDALLVDALDKYFPLNIDDARIIAEELFEYSDKLVFEE